MSMTDAFFFFFFSIFELTLGKTSTEKANSGRGPSGGRVFPVVPTAMLRPPLAARLVARRLLPHLHLGVSKAGAAGPSSLAGRGLVRTSSGRRTAGRPSQGDNRASPAQGTVAFVPETWGFAVRRSGGVAHAFSGVPDRPT